MKIFVLIKQVPDTETKIRLMPDQNGIEISDIKWILAASMDSIDLAIERMLSLSSPAGKLSTMIKPRYLDT